MVKFALTLLYVGIVEAPSLHTLSWRDGLDVACDPNLSNANILPAIPFSSDGVVFL